jgi:hypothetical protein
MHTYKKAILVKGKPVIFDAINIAQQTFVMTGSAIKIVKIHQEWFQDVENPDIIVQVLREFDINADLFTFIQRLPDVNPLFSYYREDERVTALPIQSYNHWLERQITSETRKKIKRATKREVDIRIVSFDEGLVRGISNIFNESPIKQGKRAWHYGKDSDTVRRDIGLDLENCEFVGAYYKGELIGILKLFCAQKVAEPVIIATMYKFRDKYLNNALIAKAVEICASKGIPYIVYGSWRRGDQAEFLRRHGFEKMTVPRYYVPLTTKGKLGLALNLHIGIKDRLPEKLMLHLIELRRQWYLRRYRVPENV